MNPKRLTEIVDATMPGRRIGSTSPEDCTGAVAESLGRLYGLLPDELRLSTLATFLAAHNERSDLPFVTEFRRQAIRQSLRDAVEQDHGSE